MRVLMWILDRCDGKAEAVKTPIGYEPRPEDINIEGLSIDVETIAGLLRVDKELWLEDAKGIGEFYEKFGDKLPAELREQLAALQKRLG